MTLYAAGFVPVGAFPFHWATWWGGDVMGVFVFAPILLRLFSPGVVVSRQRKMTVGLSLAAAFLVVVFLFQAAKSRVAQVDPFPGSAS